MFRIIKKTVLAIVLLCLYLISTVPVGLFLYTMKSDILGLNIFSKTGFHAYMQCLQEQAYKIEIHQSEKMTNEEVYRLEIEKKRSEEKVAPNLNE